MLSRPVNRRSVLRGGAGITAAALLASRAQGLAAAAQDAGSQELRIASAGAAVRLDPHLSYGVSQIGTFTYFLWAGLTKVDASLTAVPDIATSWDLSEDGKTYTFHLDPDRKFSDGSPITAHDVVWSWTRSLNPATESLVAGGYLKDVVGAQDYWQGEIPDPPTSYTAVDDYTFQVELISPRNYFPEVLIHPSTFVVKQSEVEAGTEDSPWFMTAKAFSGPYAVESYTPNESLILTANTNYPIPHAIQRVSYRLVDDPATQFLLYQNDEVDFTPLGVPDADNIKNNDETYRDQLIEQPQWWQNNLYLRVGLEPFEDEHVRRAFMMAIDKDALNAAILKGLNPNIDGIYYPGMDVYSADLPRIAFDPEAAKAELAASTYGSADALPPVSFYVSGDAQTGTEARLAAAMQEMWSENLGVDVETRIVATYDEMLQSDVQIVIGGEAMHYPDASGVGYFLCESGANISQFCDPELDAKYEAAAATQDPAESLALYQEVEQALVERAAFFPLHQVVAFALVKPTVQNFTLTAMYTFPDLDKVTIAAE